jgi:hypothetical protein
LSLQIVFGGASQFLLFCLVDAHGGTAKIEIATHAYLNEYECAVIAHNQVNFAMGTTKISFYEFKSFLLQKVVAMSSAALPLMRWLASFSAIIFLLRFRQK